MEKINRKNLINPINLRKFSYLCSKCKDGFLRIKPDIGYIYNPIPLVSEDEMDDEHNYRKAFHQRASCDNCSDETLFAGEVQYKYEQEVIELPDGETDIWDGYLPTNIVRYVEPAIDLIDISYLEDAHAQKKNLSKGWTNCEIIPAEIAEIKKFAKCLEKSFSLYWFDESACANKIRTAVEILKHAIGKAQLEKVPSYKTNSELLQSLLTIGNNGSHTTGKKISQEDLLDAYDVLNSILYDYYGKHDQYINDIKDTSDKIKKKFEYRRTRKK